MITSYDVRIWNIQVHEGKARRAGKPVCTYRPRWVVAGEVFGESFKTKALAESFRSKLVTYQREGVAFDVATGLPEPMARLLNTKTWYEHAIAFVDMKWPHAAGNQRKSIAESLAHVTPALLSSTRGAPIEAEIRRALYSYVFNTTRRKGGSPPEDLAATVRWLSTNTVKLNDLQDAALVRKALDKLSLRTTDGKPAAANTIARKRAVFYGCLRYGVELRLLPAHPMDNVQWVTPKSDDEVDRRSVVNPRQALALLYAVCAIAPWLVAFFACLYFAGLRPAEAVHLRDVDCDLPEDDGWGTLRLSGSTPHVGEGWGNDATAVREDRELKHRAKSTIRPVPAPPPLVRILRWHIAVFGCAPDGRLFITRHGLYGGGPVSRVTYSRVWRAARKAALTPAQHQSPLAKRPYDLRHACLSLQLNAGVPATQVAEWAGHSVQVLLRVYAKCIEGQDEAARRHIEGALDMEEDQGER